MTNKKDNLKLTKKELENSGVTKLVMVENKDLKKEVSSLKKSLKGLQDVYQQKEQDYSILKFKTNNNALIEVLKFFASAVLGFSISLYFSSANHTVSISVGFISILVFVLLIVFDKVFLDIKGKERTK